MENSPGCFNHNRGLSGESFTNRPAPSSGVKYQKHLAKQKLTRPTNTIIASKVVGFILKKLKKKAIILAMPEVEIEFESIWYSLHNYMEARNLIICIQFFEKQQL